MSEISPNALLDDDFDEMPIVENGETAQCPLMNNRILIYLPLMNNTCR